MKAFKKSISELRDRATSKLSGTVKKGYRYAQMSFAQYMQKKTVGLSKRSLMVGLFLFIVISVIYNGWVLIGSPTASEMRFGSIKIPQKADKSTMVTNAYNLEIKRVKRFRKYMDSLYHAPGGRATYDSIMLARPGLLDSARAIEKLVGE